MTRVSTLCTQEVLMVSGRVYEVTFEASADLHYVPAKLGGPPEDCHPDESYIENPEYKIIKVLQEGVPVFDWPDVLNRRLDLSAADEQLWETFFRDGA